MKNIWFRGLRLWVQGLLLFALRLAQLKTGFDPATGLSLPCMPGTALWICIAACAAAELILCLRLPAGKYAYQSCFLPPRREHAALLILGAGLLGAGSALSLGSDPLLIALTAAGVAAAGGLILLARQLYLGKEAGVMGLLPLMLFSVILVLAVYFPEECNPVLARYDIPVLATAFFAYALYQLACFFRREGSPRWLSFAGDLSVLFCLAAAADALAAPGRLAVYLGGALVVTVFLLLRRSEPLPEPAPGGEGEEADGGAPAL